jgi:hypothetical protein
VGVVLKTNGTICQGLKVSCIGRSNDVPNLPDGKFFIGSATNTTESDYGLPTTAPNNGETLVYNDVTDDFEGGYPTSSGQVSTLSLSTTNSGSTSDPTISLRWGRVSDGSLTFTPTMRAGLVMGVAIEANGQTITALPVTPGSTVSLDFSIECSAPIGTLATVFMASKVGWFAYFTNVGSVITADGTYNTISIVEEDVVVENVALANAFQFNLAVLAGGPVSYRNAQCTITVNHA